ncbi:FliG C-terminal domain-containing protein [Paludibacterium denitrificans]|uniref:FliG C-terminal domain-containing protein n=1 Tax=Paludibacterium denitrificans TaxID=2675226 RepID=UPI001E3E619C|nr:FliG C-terminal domain-containing protein [Paludibacterium denitrificans]
MAERIANEHVRMQAVFLSFLPSAQASQVIAALPEEGRDLLLINIARLTEVERELLVELEQVVDGCLQNLSMQSANVEGVRQAAEIINRLPGDRAQMVELLRAHDPDVVNKIESNMYDFYILCKQTEAVLTRIVEAVDMEQWAIALKGVEPEVRNALLQSMPRRQAQAFEEQVRRIGPVPLSRVHQVRQDIMVEVRNLALSGEIDLQLFAEDVVE